MVTGNFSGSVVARMNTACGGGSSSVLRKALAPFFGEHVRLVDDVNLHAHRRGGKLHRFSERSNLVDSPIARRIDFQDVERRTSQDRSAVFAGVVRRGSRSGHAVDTTRQDLGSRGFSRTARTRKEIRVSELAALNCRGQGADDRVLADEIGKGSGAPGAVQGHDDQPLAGRFKAPAGG